MDRAFIHSGAMGDLLYCLPTMKALGGGTLHLVDTHKFAPSGQMCDNWRELLTPLLREQPYIADVSWEPPGGGVVDLNVFRQAPALGDVFLADSSLRMFELPTTWREEPWLMAKPLECFRPVVFARSARYHNPKFPWRRVIEEYQDYAVFTGTPAEHAAFNLEFDAHVNYIPTTDLWEVARLIACSALFVGNQSAPLAIAHGLKKEVVVEASPTCPNCYDPRPDCYHGTDENVWLPGLEEIINVSASVR